MKYRRHREFVHPDRGKGVLEKVTRKTIRSCGILLVKAAEGLFCAVRVWLPARPRRYGRWQ